MARSDTLRLPPSSAPHCHGQSEDAGGQAQILGAGGARRGLREGAAARGRARAAYLRAEWSGADDRRPPAGLIRRTRV